MKIGEYNQLTVSRAVDFGVYLADENGLEVLLPTRYISEPLHPGDTINVFVYRDSEDRPIATTEQPTATVGQFAFMRVKEVSRVGAFLDWGLPKDLLVPFNEQKVRLRQGDVCPVYVYLDHASGRVVASAKIDKYLGNLPPTYRRGQQVKAMIFASTPIGYRAVVNDAHAGMIYANEIYEPLQVGQTVEAHVKAVRPDGKIDLTLAGTAADRTQALADRILQRLQQGDTAIAALSDSSSPDLIRSTLQCSKKDFKKALGALYRQQLIILKPGGIELAVN